MRKHLTQTDCRRRTEILRLLDVNVCVCVCSSDILEDEEDDTIHMGNAIMTFYAALIDLLGRCAPEMHVSDVPTPTHSSSSQPSPTPTVLCLLPHQLIHAGKGEAIRIRAILRSLIPIQDLVGVISIPFSMPSLGKGRFTYLVINWPLVRTSEYYYSNVCVCARAHRWDGGGA